MQSVDDIVVSMVCQHHLYRSWGSHILWLLALLGKPCHGPSDVDIFGSALDQCTLGSYGSSNNTKGGINLRRP